PTCREYALWYPALGPLGHAGFLQIPVVSCNEEAILPQLWEDWQGVQAGLNWSEMRDFMAGELQNLHTTLFQTLVSDNLRNRAKGHLMDEEQIAQDVLCAHGNLL